MEFEEIVKRVEWLDEQQRKGKTEFTELNGQMNSLSASVNSATQRLKVLDQRINDLAVAAARVEQFDQMLAKHRTDLGKMIEPIEKNAMRREQESAKMHHAELEEIRKTIFQLSSIVSAEEGARRDRAHEEHRLTLSMQDLGTAVETVARQSKDVLEVQKGFEESRRQDAKRLADLQAELAAIRKRSEEAREKTILHSDSIRNMENRITELAETETGRQEEHAALMQQHALRQVDRDRAWKEWQEKYESFRQHANSAEGQIVALQDSVGAARQAQEAYDGLNQQLERRIAEIGEIQRLAEERIRQEWVSFKADDQKRWTGQTLSQDDSMRDLRKDVDKIEARLTAIDDATQTLQDQLQQTTDTTEGQLKELMNISQDWLAAYERIMGHAKAKAKKSGR